MKNANTNLILEQALTCLKNNWVPLPVGENKKPLMQWKQFQNVRPTEDQVTKWFSKFPNANLAIITGEISGIIVVDIDPRHGGSNELFNNIQTVNSKTGGGGWHYFFKYEEGIRNHTGLKPGIDLRAEAGYVVIPPSRHNSGNRYEWVISPFGDMPIAPLPNFVKEWIQEEKVKVYTNNKKEKSGKIKKSTFDDSILNGVSEGRRNNAASSYAGHLFTNLPQEKWEEIWEILISWNKRNTPPLPEEELRQVYDSIQQRELSRQERKSTWTETPKGIEKQALLTKPITYLEILQRVDAFLPGYEAALRIVLAIAISCIIPLPVLLWMLLVDVPSSGKTDLARLLKDALLTYYLDTLTQNAFITGERPTESQPVFDLLPLLDKKCFIVKDLTATFSLNEQMTKKILGDLINIYDKEYSKHSSRRGTIAYESHFSFIGAITPSTLNRHVNYLNMLGPRFLCYKLPETSSEDEIKSKDNIFNENYDRNALEKETRLYVSSYLQQLMQKPFIIKPFSQQIKQYLWLSAQFMSCCRGIIITQASKFRNDEGKEISYYEVIDVQNEKPWRALQQLIGLAKCLAFVAGKDEVGTEELSIIKDIVTASMPADRSKALRIVSEKRGMITAKELADESEVSHRTSSRLLEELCGLKILSKIQGSGSMASEYQIIDKFRSFVCSDPQEFLSTYSSGTETSSGIETDVDYIAFDNDTKELEHQQEPTQTRTGLQKEEKDGEILLKPCYCGSTKFWKTKFNNVVCAVCHPPTSEEDVLEWFEAKIDEG